MKYSIQEITAKISALPESMQQEVCDFIDFIQTKVNSQSLQSTHEPALLSEQALAIDWNQPEEDKAWMAIKNAELKSAKKRRTPPPQFAGHVKELGDVMSSTPASEQELTR